MEGKMTIKTMTTIIANFLSFQTSSLSFTYSASVLLQNALPKTLNLNTGLLVKKSRITIAFRLMGVKREYNVGYDKKAN